MTHHTQQRFRWMSTCLAALMAVSLLGLPAAFAKPRKDLDGRRLGARQLILDTERKDHLSAPEDASDWSYLKVQSAGHLLVAVKGVPVDSSLRVSLTDASGKVLITQDGSKGALTLEMKVKPGIYYIQVSSKTKLRYSLSASLKVKNLKKTKKTKKTRKK